MDRPQTPGLQTLGKVKGGDFGACLELALTLWAGAHQSPLLVLTAVLEALYRLRRLLARRMGFSEVVQEVSNGRDFSLLPALKVVTLFAFFSFIHPCIVQLAQVSDHPLCTLTRCPSHETTEVALSARCLIAETNLEIAHEMDSLVLEWVPPVPFGLPSISFTEDRFKIEVVCHRE